MVLLIILLSVNPDFFRRKQKVAEFTGERENNENNEKGNNR